MDTCGPLPPLRSLADLDLSRRRSRRACPEQTYGEHALSSRASIPSTSMSCGNGIDAQVCSIGALETVAAFLFPAHVLFLFVMRHEGGIFHLRMQILTLDAWQVGRHPYASP